MDPESTQLIGTEDYELECTIVDGATLILKACTLNKGFDCKVLEGKISLDMLNKCTLTDFSELKQHLMESIDNHEIDWEKRQFKIVAITNLRNKKTSIQLLKIKMQEIQVKKRSGLQGAITLCTRAQDLSASEIKKIFLAIMKELKNRGDEQSNEVVDSIISKIGVVSQKSQYLQMRLQAQIQQIRQLAIKNKEQLDSETKRNTQELDEYRMLSDKQAQQIQLEIKRNKANIQFSEELSIELNKKMDEYRKQMGQRIKKCERMSEKFGQQLQRQQEKLAKLMLNIQHLIGRQSPKKQERMIMQKQQLMDSPVKSISVSKMFTISNQDKNKYKISDRIIQRIGSDSQSSGVVGNLNIGKMNKFRYKIVKTDAWGVSIGIKDTKNNEVIKYGGNGWISNCSNTIYSQGKGITNGDTLTVTIDTAKSEIKWEVENKQTKYSYETKCPNTKISAKDREWYAFITMSIGDIIQVL